MAKGDIYVANTDGFVHLDDGTEDGTDVKLEKGVTRVREGHPLLKGARALFDPITVHYDVEQATSAPGERRGQK